MTLFIHIYYLILQIVLYSLSVCWQNNLILCALFSVSLAHSFTYSFVEINVFVSFYFLLVYVLFRVALPNTEILVWIFRSVFRPLHLFLKFRLRQIIYLWWQRHINKHLRFCNRIILAYISSKYSFIGLKSRTCSTNAVMIISIVCVDTNKYCFWCIFRVRAIRFLSPFFIHA